MRMHTKTAMNESYPILLITQTLSLSCFNIKYHCLHVDPMVTMMKLPTEMQTGKSNHWQQMYIKWIKLSISEVNSDWSYCYNPINVLASFPCWIRASLAYFSNSSIFFLLSSASSTWNIQIIEYTSVRTNHFYWISSHIIEIFIHGRSHPMINWCMLLRKAFDDSNF